VLTIVDTEQNLVYWVLVSEGGFEETHDNYKIIVPEVQRLDASAAHAIGQLAMQAPAQLQAKLRALAGELSDATAAELERHRLAWREGDAQIPVRGSLRSCARPPNLLRLTQPSRRVSSATLRPPPWTKAVTLNQLAHGQMRHVAGTRPAMTCAFELRCSGETMMSLEPWRSSQTHQIQARRSCAHRSFVT
jgi:hypothetical protein